MNQRVPTSPITLCGERVVRPGHICAFFDSPNEKYQTLAPYFTEGLAAGDRLLNVVDADSRTQHLRQLAENNVPLATAMGSGQLEVLTSEETYLKDGAEDLEGMLDLMRETLETSRREGRRVRTCGEMNWIERSRMAGERVMEYEARVNEFVPTFDCTLLCVYDLAHTPPGLMSDILATHPFAIIKGRARPNPYFVPPQEYLGMMSTFPPI
ncbi:MAG: MEDS domain-containing protein [Gemmatimonadaceae bacterium]